MNTTRPPQKSLSEILDEIEERRENELWTARRLEGFKRDVCGLMIGQSKKAIFKSTDLTGLQRVACAHNESAATDVKLVKALRRAINGLECLGGEISQSSLASITAILNGETKQDSGKQGAT